MPDIDKYGCDECWEKKDLGCCERCDALVCADCYDAHMKREHTYPINFWKRPKEPISILQMLKGKDNGKHKRVRLQTRPSKGSISAAKDNDHTSSVSIS